MIMFHYTFTNGAFLDVDIKLSTLFTTDSDMEIVFSPNSFISGVENEIAVKQNQLISLMMEMAEY